MLRVPSLELDARGEDLKSPGLGLGEELALLRLLAPLVSLVAFFILGEETHLFGASPGRFELGLLVFVQLPETAHCCVSPGDPAALPDELGDKAVFDLIGRDPLAELNPKGARAGIGRVIP